MKKNTFLCLLLITSFGYSQDLPITFEDANDSNIIASVADGGAFTIIDDIDNATEKVGEFVGVEVVDPFNGSYDHIYVPLSTPLDLSATSTISFRVKQVGASGSTNHLFKIQSAGGTGSDDQIAFSTTADVWEDVTLVFTGTGTFNELIIFFDFENTTRGTYLIDNIEATVTLPTCSDGIQNGTEEEVDCGGSSCDPCTATTEVGPDANISLDGYIFVNNAADDTPAFDFGYPADLMKAVRNITNNTVTCMPNFAIWTAESNNPAWFANPSPDPSVASDPNKKVQGNSFVTVLESNNPFYFTKDFTFSGQINSYDLGSEYEVSVFIKVFNGGYSDEVVVRQTLSSTDTNFSITYPKTSFEDADEIIQYGYTVYGLITDPTLENTAGYNGVEFQAITLSTEDLVETSFRLFPNPTKDSWTVKTKNINMSSINVYDVLGKNVISISPNSREATIEGISLRRGMYFAQIKTAKDIKSIKIIKE